MLFSLGTRILLSTQVECPILATMRVIKKNSGLYLILIPYQQ